MAKTKQSSASSAVAPVTPGRSYETGGKAAATRQVLAEKGFTGMRLSDVGEVAGVQAPAIYYHFSNKEDLAGEVFVSGLVRWRLALETTLKAHEGDDALGRLALAIDAHLRLAARQSDYARAWMHRIVGDLPAQVQELCLPERRAYARVWTRLIVEAKDAGFLRDDVDAKVAQQLLLGALNALTYTWKTGRTPPVDVAVLSAQQMLLSGLSFEERDWSRVASSESSLVSS
jgi:AcrR family transcriptional regulator